MARRRVGWLVSVKRCRSLGGRAVGGTVGNHEVECSRHFVFPLVSLKQQTLDLCDEELLSVTCGMLFLDLSRQEGSLSSNECPGVLPSADLRCPVLW